MRKLQPVRIFRIRLLLRLCYLLTIVSHDRERQALSRPVYNTVLTAVLTWRSTGHTALLNIYEYIIDSHRTYGKIHAVRSSKPNLYVLMRRVHRANFFTVRFHLEI